MPAGFKSLMGRAVPPNPASDVSLVTAQSWFTECLERHRTCGATYSKPRTLPTRVIDVGPTDSTQNPRLHVSQGETGSWAALSYCWGGTSSFVLKSTNIDQFGSGKFSANDYPPTLIDAVYITRALKIRYLWIDALCIMQDSAEDWAQESARMKDVYSGAILTIAAMGSNSAQAGMLQERSISAEACMIEWKSGKNAVSSNVFLRPGFTFWDVTMKDEPINRRGWTLQESLLSPRTLSYSSRQMVWECQECRTSESGRPRLSGERCRDKGFIQSLLSNRPSVGERVGRGLMRFLQQITPRGWMNLCYNYKTIHGEIYSRWYAIVAEFSRRDLTMQSDDFPALSDLAATFHNFLHEQYCAGLWRYDMIRGLLWQRKRLKGQKSYRQNELSGAVHQHIPTWSWASINGEKVRFQLVDEFISCGRHRLGKIARVVSCRIHLSTCDPFGHISGGYIVLRAPFLQIDDPRSKNVEKWSTRFPTLHEEVWRQLGFDDEQAEFHQQHKAYVGQKFALIRIVKRFSGGSPKAFLLLLESTGKQKNEYRRLGLIIITHVEYLSPNHIYNVSFDEMNETKWQWKTLRLV